MARTERTSGRHSARSHQLAAPPSQGFGDASRSRPPLPRARLAPVHRWARFLVDARAEGLAGAIDVGLLGAGDRRQRLPTASAQETLVGLAEM
jgi:hypothetical protein